MGRKRLGKLLDPQVLDMELSVFPDSKDTQVGSNWERPGILPALGSVLFLR
jgi:hypothetical protein